MKKVLILCLVFSITTQSVLACPSFILEKVKNHEKQLEKLSTRENLLDFLEDNLLLTSVGLTLFGTVSVYLLYRDFDLRLKRNIEELKVGLAKLEAKLIEERNIVKRSVDELIKTDDDFAEIYKFANELNPNVIDDIRKKISLEHLKEGRGQKLLKESVRENMLASLDQRKKSLEYFSEFTDEARKIKLLEGLSGFKIEEIHKKVVDSKELLGRFTYDMEDLSLIEIYKKNMNEINGDMARIQWALSEARIINLVAEHFKKSQAESIRKTLKNATKKWGKRAIKFLPLTALMLTGDSAVKEFKKEEESYDVYAGLDTPNAKYLSLSLPAKCSAASENKKLLENIEDQIALMSDFVSIEEISDEAPPSQGFKKVFQGGTSGI